MVYARAVINAPRMEHSVNSMPKMRKKFLGNRTKKLKIKNYVLIAENP